MRVQRFVIALVVLLAGCSASHTANPTSVLPGTPSLASQGGADPFSLHQRNVIHSYAVPNPPVNMATGSDKSVWFTEQSVARIGKITQDGVITEYTIPSGQVADDIAPGANGTLWFTEGSQIGKIQTTTGQITEFPLPPGDSADSGITKGPDGNMWFTDHAGNGVGKMWPTGAVKEFPLQQGTQPVDITVGPDGNLWFVGSQDWVWWTNAVGNITIHGVVTEYWNADHGQHAIAAGPDGNLWVTTFDSFDKVTTEGEISRFYTLRNYWNDVVLGPGKKMWMTNYGFGEIQTWNPATSGYSDFLLAQATGLGGLTVGGDGDVWIADTPENRILVYEDKITTIGVRLNGELSFTDPNYGFELGYAIGTSSTQTQTISLRMGESVQFKNVDTVPHSVAFLGDATSNSAPWPVTFNGSTSRSPAGTAIGTAGWATGSLLPNKSSPVYETGLPGFYMIGCQYHYDTNEMRTVVVVH